LLLTLLELEDKSDDPSFWLLVEKRGGGGGGCIDGIPPTTLELPDELHKEEDDVSF
jgi:hypothetical protein